MESEKETEEEKKSRNHHRWRSKTDNNAKHIPGNCSDTASGPASVITYFDDSGDRKKTYASKGLNLLSQDFLPVMKPEICCVSCPSVATEISSWPRDSQNSSRLFRSMRTSAKSGSCREDTPRG